MPWSRPWVSFQAKTWVEPNTVRANAVMTGWRREVSSWWVRIDPVLTLGIVQITPMGHMLAPAIVALLAWAAVEQNQATANLLGISSDEGVLVTLLAYVLVQVGRVVHEVGHAVTGVYTGRRLLAVRLTPLFVAVERVVACAPRQSPFDGGRGQRRSSGLRNCTTRGGWSFRDWVAASRA
jgi:hypothetical protein